MFREIIKTLGAAVFCGAAVWGAITMVGINNSNEPLVQQTVAKVQAPVETAKHTACRLKLHSENPYGGTYNGLSNLVWDTDAFGTYNDGSVWVGYNRKVGDKVFYNMSKIC